MKRRPPMKKTAQAVAAASIAAAPFTLGASAAPASTEPPDIPNLTMSANSVKLFVIEGESIDLELVQHTGSGHVKGEVTEYGELVIESLSLGSASFTLQGYVDGIPHADTFAVNVIDAGADGRIDVSDVVAFTRANAERALTSAEVADLLGGVDSRGANNPPLFMHSNIGSLTHSPAPIGGTASFGLAPLFADLEKDAIAFELAPLPFPGETPPEASQPLPDITEYVTVSPDGEVVANIPYGYPSYFGIGMFAVNVEDARGASMGLPQPITIPVYHPHLFWNADAYGVEDFTIFHGSIPSLGFLASLGEALNVTVELSDEIDPNVRDAIATDAYMDGLLHLEVTGSQHLALADIPAELPFTLAISGHEPGRTLELPMKLIRNAAPSSEGETSYVYEWNLSAEEAASGEFNRPIDLYELFGDPDLERGDELSFAVTSTSPSLANLAVIDEAAGELSIHLEFPTSALVEVTATDSTGATAQADIYIQTNEAPAAGQPVVDVVDWDIDQDGWYGEIDFYDEDGLTFTLGPEEAVAALDAEIAFASASVAGVQINEIPAEPQTLLLTAEDPSGRKANAELKVVFAESLLVDEADYNHFDLDELFQDPTGDTYAYYVEQPVYNSSSAFFEHDYDSETETLTVSYFDDEPVKMAIRALDPIEDTVLKSKYLRIGTRTSTSPAETIQVQDWNYSVTENVYEGTLPLAGIFPDFDAEDQLFFASSDSELQLTGFDAVSKNISVKYPYDNVYSATRVTVLRLRADGVYEAESFYITTMPPV